MSMERRYALIGHVHGNDGGGTDSTTTVVSTDESVGITTTVVGDNTEYDLSVAAGSDTTTTVISTDETVAITTNIAGSNTEFDLSVTCCAGGGTNPPVAVATTIGSAILACSDSSTSFTPSADTPAAQVGDLVVWLVWFSHRFTSSTYQRYAAAVPPAGWSTLKTDGYPGWIDGNTKILYRFLEAGDIAATHTVTEGMSGSGGILDQICSRVWVFRGAHPDIPFSCFANRGRQSEIRAPRMGHMPGDFDGQQVIHVIWANEDVPSIPFGWETETPLDSAPYTDVHLSSVNGTAIEGYCWSGLTEIEWNDENWFGGETKDDSVILGDWIQVFSDKTARTLGTRQTVLSAQASNTEHYFERTVTLEAGERYMWSALVGEDGSSGAFAMRVTSPSGQRRQDGFYCTSGTTSWVRFATGRIDDTADHLTNWRVYGDQTDTDGIPSTSGAWFTHYFVAPEAGEYTLRLYLTDTGFTGPVYTYTGGSSDKLRIGHMGFRRGWYVPHAIYTETGPRMREDGGTRTQRSYLRTWMQPSDNNWSSLAVAINPNTTQKLVRFDSTATWKPEFGGIAYPDADGYTTVIEAALLGCDDDYDAAFGASRPIYPTIGGVKQKYYWEVQFSSHALRTYEDHSVGLALFGTRPKSGDTSSAIDLNAGITWWNTYIKGVQSETLSSPGKINPNDVIGVAIDFTTREVRFYRNGTQAGSTYTIPDTFPYDASSDNLPFLKADDTAWFATIGVGSTRGTAKALMRKEQWLYAPPSVDYIAYDWCGDPDATSFVDPVPVTGPGYGIFYVDELTGETKQRSLVQGDGIAILQFPTYIRISALPYTFTSMGAGASVYSTIVPSATEFNVRLRSFIGTSPITVAQNANDITLGWSPVALGALSNVTLAAEAVNHVLTWNGSAWVNAAVPRDIKALSDVDSAMTPASNDVLTWDGAQWTAAPPPGGGGGGGGETNTASNVGTGAGVFKVKVGTDLRFRSVLGAQRLAASAGTDEVTVGLDTAGARWGDSLLFDGTNWILSGARGAFHLFEDCINFPATTPWSGWDLYTTGTGASAGSAYRADSPGVWTFNTGTTTTGQSQAVMSQSYSATSNNPFAVGHYTIRYRTRWRIITNLPSTGNVAFPRNGLVDELSGAPGNGIYFSCDDDGAGNFNLSLWARNGSVTTQVSTVTAVLNQWYVMEFEVNAAGTAVDWWIDGVAQTQVTTTIPASTTGLTLGCGIQKSNGATSVGMDVDYMELLCLPSRT
jgi:hypothetical protein